MLEDVAVGLDEVALATDGVTQAGRRVGSNTSDSQRSAPSARVERPLLEPLEPGPVLAQVVHEDPGLALEGPDPGQPLELAGVEPAGRDGDPQPELAGSVARLELDLVDREAEIVEPADPGRDREPVVGAELDLGVELVPQPAVARPHALGGGDRLVELVGPLVVDREVRQPEGHVLDEDLEVVRALAVGQRGMDLARLGVDEVGLDLVAVAPEERVGERAVAPVDAAPMEVDEQRRHRVEQPVAVGLRPGRQTHQQPPVLERVGEVAR